MVDGPRHVDAGPHVGIHVLDRDRLDVADQALLDDLPGDVVAGAEAAVLVDGELRLRAADGVDDRPSALEAVGHRLLDEDALLAGGDGVLDDVESEVARAAHLRSCHPCQVVDGDVDDLDGGVFEHLLVAGVELRDAPGLGGGLTRLGPRRRRRDDVEAILLVGGEVTPVGDSAEADHADAIAQLGELGHLAERWDRRRTCSPLRCTSRLIGWLT